MIEEAKKLGYTVVYTREELNKLSLAEGKVLGLFATEHTFNEGTEQQLQKRKLPYFQPQSPRFDQVVEFALRYLGQTEQGFLKPFTNGRSPHQMAKSPFTSAAFCQADARYCRNKSPDRRRPSHQMSWQAPGLPRSMNGPVACAGEVNRVYWISRSLRIVIQYRCEPALAFGLAHMFAARVVLHLVLRDTANDKILTLRVAEI